MGVRLLTTALALVVALAVVAAAAAVAGSDRDKKEKASKSPLSSGDNRKAAPGRGIAHSRRPQHAGSKDKDSKFPSEEQRATTSLPTWSNDYEWLAGHGYAGWLEFESSAAPGGYAFERGLPGRPGLWLSPVGGRRYRAASAAWVYDAPGTTRLLRSEVTLAYNPRLLSHHCVEVALRDDAGQVVDSHSFCKPPVPPAGNPTRLKLTLDDLTPDGPIATQLTAGLELRCGRRQSLGRGRTRSRKGSRRGRCVRRIPAALPTKNGLNVRGVSMVLVDDDRPQVSPAGDWFDLRDGYVDGRETHDLVAAASDAGGGIRRVAVEQIGIGEIASVQAPCDATHQTLELDNRVCPESFAAPLMIDASGLPEGRHRYRETAEDIAGNVGASEEWSVYVDRTPPMPARNFSAALDAESAAAYVRWDPVSDPRLADGSFGSGVAGYVVRFRRSDADWSASSLVEQPELVVSDSYESEGLDVEVRSKDLVGNIGEPVVVSLRVASSVGDLDGPAIYAGAELADRDGDYVGTGDLPLLVGADDEDDGVAKLFALAEDGRELVTEEMTCLGGCSATAETTFTLNTTALSEGITVLRIGAVDGSGNRTIEPATEIFVDHTAPAAPSNIRVAEYDGDARVATVVWTGGTDPVLLDGVPGAGRASSLLRVLRDGEWGKWQLVEDNEFLVKDLDTDEAFAVEIKSRDKVGNASSATHQELTGAETPDRETEREAQLLAQSAHGEEAEASSFTNCAPKLEEVYEINTRALYAAFRPVETIIRTRMVLACRGIEARFDRVEIRAGLAIKTGDGTAPSDFEKVTRLEKLTGFARPKRLPAAVYRNGPSFECTPRWGGSRRYVAYVKLTYIDDDTGEERSVDTDTGRGGIGPGPMTGTCPVARVRRARELSGFRYLSSYRVNRSGSTKPGTARRHLRAELGNQPHTPDDVRNAWQAHHIVPIGERGADDMRSLLFRCRVHPNQAGNGIYLRGRGLRKDTEAYEKLVAHDDRHDTRLHKRAYHLDTRRENGALYVRTLRDHFLARELRDFPERRCPQAGEDAVVDSLRDAAGALARSGFGVETNR